MNEYHETYEIEQVMLSTTQHHMTKKKNQRIEMAEFEDAQLTGPHHKNILLVHPVDY